jgi:hypothetical protein
MVKLPSLAAVSLAAAVLFPASAFAAKPKPISVPEINGTHAGVALVLVLGGAAVVLGRRRRQAR